MRQNYGFLCSKTRCIARCGKIERNVVQLFKHLKHFTTNSFSSDFVYEKTRSENLFGEMVILAGHCPLTDLHLEPCVDTNNQKCFFTMRGVVRMSVGR